LAAGGAAFGFGAGFSFFGGSSETGCGLAAGSGGGDGGGDSLAGTPNDSSSEFQRSVFPGSAIRQVNPIRKAEEIAS
jgi:hypothetical protein